MQFFDRDQVPVPALLRSPQADRARRAMIEPMLYADERRDQTSLRPEHLKDDGSLRAQLETLFHGRCAFCESDSATMSYTFRPATEAQPPQFGQSTHLYYAWLAHAWENFYAICRSCEPDDANYFPVVGKRCQLPTRNQLRRYLADRSWAWHEQGHWRVGVELRQHPPDEQPLFLDPCVNEAFHEHLHTLIDGRLLSLSERGQATIAAFKLNRVDLQERRHKVFVDRINQLQKWLASVSRSPVDDLFGFQTMQFGGTWYLLLRRVAGFVFGDTCVEQPDLFTPTRIGDLFAKITQRESSMMLERLQLEYNSSVRPELARENSIDASWPTFHSLRSTARIGGLDFVNFKSLERLSLDMPPGDVTTAGTIAPALLVLGENATGKSSVLEGVALALASVAARRRATDGPDDFVLDPRHLGAEVISADYVRAVPCVFVRLTDGRSVELTVAPDKFDGVVKVDGIVDEQEHGIPVFAYGAFRHYRTRRPGETTDRHIRNLFGNDELPSPEQWLFELDAERFAMVVRTLREILSIDGEFEVIRRDAQDGRCYIITAVADLDDKVAYTRTPLEAASSGFRSVLAMVCDVMRGLMDPRINPGFESLATARGVVLIDEIEAHLHPRWKMQIMSSLRRAFPRVTFIATTHDPLCLRGMKDGEVVVLQRVPVQGAQPWEPQVRIEALTQLPRLDELRIDQLLTSDFFQLHTTSAPEIDRTMARIADLLAKPDLTGDEQRTVDEFRRDIAAALPVGDTEIHRIVQEAVADYLRERRAASAHSLATLQADTKRRIVDALKGRGNAPRSAN